MKNKSGQLGLDLLLPHLFAAEFALGSAPRNRCKSVKNVKSNAYKMNFDSTTKIILLLKISKILTLFNRFLLELE